EKGSTGFTVNHRGSRQLCCDFLAVSRPADAYRSLGYRGGAAGLLKHVRCLMRQQPKPLRRARVKAALAEEHIAAAGEGVRGHRMRHRIGGRPGVNAQSREVAVEPIFQETSYSTIERSPAGPCDLPRNLRLHCCFLLSLTGRGAAEAQ